MKKQNKTKRYIIVALLAFMALGATQVFATPGDIVSPLIHKGAGAQIAVDMILGASSPTSALLDANQSGRNSVFDGLPITDAIEADTALDSQTFMTVLGNSWLQNMVFIGKNRDATIDWTFLVEAPAGGSVPLYTKASATNPLWTTAFTPAGTATLQKMNVLGGILSTDMNAAAGNATGTAQVCVDSVGTLVMCS